ncbi:MAG: hypothetical protein WBA74_21115, partial [Cyclobacteriaceae bacterium]
MDFNRELLFFFGIAGITIGIILGSYFLFFKKPGLTSNKYLGGLLLILSFRTGRSVFYFFDEKVALAFLQAGFSFGLLVGPLLFCYLSAVRHPFGRVVKYRTINVLIWLPIILIINLTYPWDSELSFWHEFFVPFIYLQWACYLLASVWVSRHVIKKLISDRSQLTRPDILKLTIYIGTFIIWLGYVVFGYDADIVGLLSFSFVSYVGLILLFGKIKLITGLGIAVDKTIEDNKTAELIRKLEWQMVNKKLYKNASVAISDVAVRLQVRDQRIEDLLEANLNMSFEEYINKHRIEEAKKLIDN